MKKAIGIIFDILSIACLLGGHIIQYYTKRKLGMLRWVVYQEAKWQQKLPMDILKYVSVIIVIFLFAGICKLFGKKLKDNIVGVSIMGIMAVVYVGACFFLTSEVIRSSFLIIPLIGIAVLVQMLKCVIVACISIKDK